MILKIYTSLTIILVCSFLNIGFIYAQNADQFDRYLNFSRLEEGRALFRPANLLALSERRLDLYMARNFGMKELSSANAFWVIPTKLFTAAGAVSSFGGRKYRENSFGLLASIPVKTSVTASIEMRMNMISIPGFSSDTEYSLIPGLGVRKGGFTAEARLLGYFYSGKIRSALSRKGVHASGSFQLNEKMLLSCGRVVQNGLPGMSSVDLLTILHEVIGVGITAHLETSAYSFRTVLRLNNLSLIIGLNRHSELGNTPHMSASFRF